MLLCSEVIDRISVLFTKIKFDVELCRVAAAITTCVHYKLYESAL